MEGNPFRSCGRTRNVRGFNPGLDSRDERFISQECFFRRTELCKGRVRESLSHCSNRSVPLITMTTWQCAWRHGAKKGDPWTTWFSRWNALYPPMGTM